MAIVTSICCAILSGAESALNNERRLVMIPKPSDPAASIWSAYGDVTAGSDAYVDADLASSPMVVPVAEQLSYAAPVESCSVEAIDFYDRLWTSFRS